VAAAEGTLERALIRDSMAQLRSFGRTMNLPFADQWPWDDAHGEKDVL